MESLLNALLSWWFTFFSGGICDRSLEGSVGSSVYIPLKIQWIEVVGMPGYGHNEESEEMREVSGLFVGVGDGGGGLVLLVVRWKGFFDI